MQYKLLFQKYFLVFVTQFFSFFFNEENIKTWMKNEVKIILTIILNNCLFNSVRTCYYHINL